MSELTMYLNNMETIQEHKIKFRGADKFGSLLVSDEGLQPLRGMIKGFFIEFKFNGNTDTFTAKAETQEGCLDAMFDMYNKMRKLWIIS